MQHRRKVDPVKQILARLDEKQSKVKGNLSLSILDIVYVFLS